MTFIKEQQKIKIIPEDINKFAVGIIISSQTDSFVAQVNNSSLITEGQEIEVLVSSDDFILLFNSKVNKIVDNNVFFSVLSKPNYVQKREYPRIPVCIPVKLFSINNDSTSQGANIINLGGGGMQMNSPFELKKNTIINTKFKLSDKNEISVLFKVLRTGLAEKGYNISGEFHQISNFNKTLIIQFCFKRQLEIKYRK